ncbi:hypothetical protein LL912_18755 [Niabella sp. CC-SYL272]|uniref:hypothetical protein n=1 Tax=Niabella agricola TaxID=2891571 RepID=UPI001F3B6041|nr:hypothetical protein [Niabella agricola]MCF3110832.1 hypothetical protein [Niabella agricola]
MKSILLLTIWLLSGSVAGAQSRKAGKGQLDFLVVTTDTVKRKSALSATGGKPADSLAAPNKTLLQKSPRTKKNETKPDFLTPNQRS